VEYHLAWNTDEDSVEVLDWIQRTVSEGFGFGWRPIGGIALAWKPVQSDGSGGLWVAAQAMVRDDPEPRQSPPEPR
jgi:hypothetical protein